jgi:hypothetical protein
MQEGLATRAALAGGDVMQPKPKANTEVASWDYVLRDISTMSLDNAYALVNDIKIRDSMGEKKYGTRLQPHNGRDTLRDAYEESLDLTVYLMTSLREGEPVYLLYRQSLRATYELRMMLLRRSGQ